MWNVFDGAEGDVVDEIGAQFVLTFANTDWSWGEFQYRLTISLPEGEPIESNMRWGRVLTRPSEVHRAPAGSTPTVGSHPLEGRWYLSDGPRGEGILQVSGFEATFTTLLGAVAPEDRVIQLPVPPMTAEPHQLTDDLGHVLFLSADEFFFWGWSERANEVARARRVSEVPARLVGEWSWSHFHSNSGGVHINIDPRYLVYDMEGWGLQTHWVYPVGDDDGIVTLVTGGDCESTITHLVEALPGPVISWIHNDDTGHTLVHPGEPQKSWMNTITPAADATPPDGSALIGRWFAQLEHVVVLELQWTADGLSLQPLGRTAQPEMPLNLEYSDGRFFRLAGNDQASWIYVLRYSPDRALLWDSQTRDLFPATRAQPVPESLRGEWLLSQTNGEETVPIVLIEAALPMGSGEEAISGRVYGRVGRDGRLELLPIGMEGLSPTWISFYPLTDSIIIGHVDFRSWGLVLYRSGSRPAWLPPIDQATP